MILFCREFSGDETMHFKRWVWTELLAFDNHAADFGIAEYLDSLGFVPDVLCLLFSSPDFFLQHDNLKLEKILSPLFCSRRAHPGNERRARQEWTNFQVRELLRLLKQAGCTPYLSCFTGYFRNEFHREWLADHPEACLMLNSQFRGNGLNPLAMLENGTLIEDIIVPQVVQTCCDYGFCGWHGPDGWGPGNIDGLDGGDFSDSMMKQFLADKEWDLPECLRQPCPKIVTEEEIRLARKSGRRLPDDGLHQIRERMEYVCRYHRDDWREFIGGRWRQFWYKMTSALHAVNLKAACNSAWTKGNFDAGFEYGIDYRKMSKIGIDTMVAETVALGMSQVYPGSRNWHDDCAASLAEIKAFAPDFELLFLHGIKDIVEGWDNLRHATPGYERELYKLANLYYRDQTGLHRSAAGLLACLADGIAKHEWQFIGKCWQTGFDGTPTTAGEVTMLWHDDMFYRGIADFSTDGMLPGQKQFSELLQRGVQIQTTCRFENASFCPSAIFVPGAHLLPEILLDELAARHPYPVIFSGRESSLQRFFEYGETITDGRMAVVILWNKHPIVRTILPTPETPYVPTSGPLPFHRERTRMAVADSLWDIAAKQMNRAIHQDLAVRGIPYPEITDYRFTLITRRMADNILDVALENRAEWGRFSTRVLMSEEITDLEILSSFPLRVMDRPDRRSFTVSVPPRGITVVRVYFKSHINTQNPDDKK